MSAGSCASEVKAGVPVENYQDMSFRDFVNLVLIRSPAQDPFTYRLEFLHQITPGKLRTCLLYVMIQVAHTVFGKKLEELNQSEVDRIQEYLHSLGFHIRYEPDPKSENVKAGKPKEELGFRDYLLFFETANPTLRKN